MFNILLSVIICISIVEINAINPLINKSTDFINILELPKRPATNEDARLSFVERANKYGYPSEAHTTTTEDGYILTIFRIVKGKNCKSEKKKVPVLLQHGLIASGIIWLDAGPEAGPAYLLADACYDVWCGNNRGVGFSKQHVNFNYKTDAKYWNFTYHEMGVYDLPAMIDYVLDKTGSETLNYIGHAQGGAIFYVLGSTRPEYLDKIGVSITMAPTTWLHHARQPLFRLAASINEQFYYIFGLLKQHEILDHNSPFAQAVDLHCNPLSVAGTLCQLLHEIFVGVNPGSVTAKTISTVTGHFPDSISVKNLIHYSQSMKYGTFRMFDYGVEMNKIIYDSPSPPDYNVSSITTPICLFYGKNDLIVVPKDVATLRSKLPNVIDFSAIGDYNHADFVLSQQNPKFLFPKIEACLKDYS